MKSTEKFYECPRCESKATFKMNYPLSLLIMGSCLNFFVVTAIIGIPLVFLSIIWFICDRFTSVRTYQCRACKYNFRVDEKEAKGE